MPYSIGTPQTIDVRFGLYWSAVEAAKKRSEATGDVVVIRDDVSFQYRPATRWGDVILVGEMTRCDLLWIGRCG